MHFISDPSHLKIWNLFIFNVLFLETAGIHTAFVEWLVSKWAELDIPASYSSDIELSLLFPTISGVMKK